AAFLYNLIETVRISAILLKPFIPDSSEAIRKQIGAAEEQFNWDSAAVWGVLGSNKVEKGANIFPRIDLKKELEELEAAAKSKAAPEPVKEEEPLNLITIDDFKKVDIRVAQVLECEPVPKSDKLLCLQLEVGSERRQVVSGIAKWYKPGDLVGKKVLLAYNLAPAKLRGVESSGMILAATVGDAARVVFVDEGIPTGSQLS
ncbi:MAG: methionine--tRNA ligase subunit beta, partial [Papillibacter sp.]|nr:methionine--tRNA ligase subunit beta [Papillibacter sp.]